MDHPAFLQETGTHLKGNALNCKARAFELEVAMAADGGF